MNEKGTDIYFTVTLAISKNDAAFGNGNLPGLISFKPNSKGLPRKGQLGVNPNVESLRRPTPTPLYF